MSVVDVPPVSVTVYTSVLPSLTAVASLIDTLSVLVSRMSPVPWPSATLTAVLLGVPKLIKRVSVPSTSVSVSVGTFTVALV